MFFVLFRAAPRPGTRTAPDAAGAFVSCWIDRPTLEEAIDAGRTSTEKEGWTVREVEEAYTVNSSTYPPGKHGHEYFEQAQIDKEVFVYHTYPNDHTDAASQ